jgi:hypothetical protein
MMVAAIGMENLCSGMGTAAYAAFLMSLCDRRFTATQYALLTSLMAVTRVVVGATTGALAKAGGGRRSSSCPLWRDPGFCCFSGTTVGRGALQSKSE